MLNNFQNNLMGSVMPSTGNQQPAWMQILMNMQQPGGMKMTPPSPTPITRGGLGPPSSGTDRLMGGRNDLSNRLGDIASQGGGAGAPNVSRPPPNTMLGGPQYPNEFRSPSGPIEEMLFKMFGGGQQQFQAPLDPLVNQLAAGQLPPAIQAQLEQNLAVQRAQLMEQYGRSNSLFGSDAASYITREQGRTVTDAMAEAQRRALDANQMNMGNFQNAMAKYLGLGTGLLGVEQQRTQTAQQMLWEEYLRSSGIPPEIAALLAAGGLGGGGSSTTTGPAPISNLGAAIGGGVNQIASLLPILLASSGGA